MSLYADAAGILGRKGPGGSRPRPLTGYWRWCRTTMDRYPWLTAVLDAEADRERGIVPTLPDGWRPVTWDDLAGIGPRQSSRGVAATVGYRRRLVARGECVGCHGAVEPERCGCWYCGRCDEGRRAKHRADRAARVAAGQCQGCGKRPPAAERRQCGPCLERLAARARRTRAARRSALCEVCGERPRLARRDLCVECCLAAQVAARAEGATVRPCA